MVGTRLITCALYADELVVSEKVVVECGAIAD